MRQETTVRTLCKFNELSEEGKRKAIEGLCDINVDHEWWNSTYDDAEAIGLKITSFDDYRCKGYLLNGSPEPAADAILENHDATCETYKTALSFKTTWKAIVPDEEGYYTQEQDEKRDELTNDFVYALLEDYRIILQKEYEYLTSEEAIIEIIEANGYEFTEDGKIA